MLIRTLKYVISPYTNGETHLSHKEAFTASFGSFSAISLIFLLTMQITNSQNTAALIAASTGATAFLIFTLPNSIFSQNWSVIAGHLTSAFIGVTCYKLLGSSIIATALSVALAVIGMHLLRCPHPPGGATALLAVVGGEPITQLGYQYALFPVLINVLALLVIAHAFNWFIKIFYRNQAVEEFVFEPSPSSHQIPDAIQLHAQDIGDTGSSFNFIKIADALKNNETKLQLGMLYSHSQHSFNASVRKVVSISDEEVSFEVVQGFAQGKIETIPYTQFLSWVRFQVNENQHIA